MATNKYINKIIPIFSREELLPSREELLRSREELLPVSVKH